MEKLLNKVQCPSTTCQSIDSHHIGNSHWVPGPYCRFNIPEINCFGGPRLVRSQATEPANAWDQASYKPSTTSIICQWNMAKVAPSDPTRAHFITVKMASEPHAIPIMADPSPYVHYNHMLDHFGLSILYTIYILPSGCCTLLYCFCNK